jgi:hypothetical protein
MAVRHDAVRAVPPRLAVVPNPVEVPHPESLGQLGAERVRLPPVPVRLVHVPPLGQIAHERRRRGRI